MKYSISIEEFKVLISFSLFFYTIYLIFNTFRHRIKINIRDKILIFCSSCFDSFAIEKNIFYNPIKKQQYYNFVFKFKNDRLLKDFLKDIGIRTKNPPSNILVMIFTHKRESGLINKRDLLKSFNDNFELSSLIFIDDSGFLVKSPSFKKVQVNNKKNAVCYDLVLSTFILTLFILSIFKKTQSKVNDFDLEQFSNADFNKNLENSDSLNDKDLEELLSIDLFSSLEKYEN